MNVDLNDFEVKIDDLFNREKKRILEYVSKNRDHVDAISVSIKFDIDYTEVKSEED